MNRWPRKPLGEFCRTGSGGTPSRRNPEYYDAGTVPWVKSGELQDSIILDTTEKISEVATRETNARLVPKNAVLVAMYGATVGKTAILGIEATTNQAVCHIIPDDQTANFRFVWYAVRSCLDQLLSKRVGGAQPNISQGIIRDTVIPVPPLVEQERIVKLLDEAGELRKLRAQADRRTTDLIPALFHEMFGDPSVNPQGFPISRIGELCETSPNYGTMVPARANEGEWLSLRVANIQDGLIDLTDQKFVDLPVEMLERHTVKDGDLLLARAIGSKEHLGKCIVARPGNHRWAFDSHLMRVRLNRQRCEPVWLKTLLDTSGGRQLFLNNTRQSAVQFNINTKEFASIVVPLPPVPQQKEFAARVYHIRAMQAEQAASRRRLDDLFQSMLHRAFQGEL